MSENPLERLIGNEPDAPADGGDANPAAPADNNELEELRASVGNLTAELEEIRGKLPTPPQEEEKPWEPGEGGWSDVDKRIEEKALDTISRVETEREEAAREAKEQEDEIRASVDKEFDEKEAAAEKEGLIPPVKDAKDPDDAGKVYRREMYGLAAVLQTTNLGQIAKILNSEHERGRAFDVKTGEFYRTRTSGFGQDAPVSSGNRGGSGKKGQIDYRTLHNTSVDELVRRATEE